MVHGGNNAMEDLLRAALADRFALQAREKAEALKIMKYVTPTLRDLVQRGHIRNVGQLWLGLLQHVRAQDAMAGSRL